MSAADATGAPAAHDNRHASLHSDRDVTFTLTMPAADRDRFMSCWREWRDGDRFERRQALREADREQGVKSLKRLLDLVMRVNFTCGSSYVIAGCLASLYNGDRVKANLFRLSIVDADIVEDLIHVIRLHLSSNCEIHDYIVNGGQIFEQMIKAYRLERKRRGS
ncbi:DUF7673 family protein [Nevskia sp.]|uniref:DUF7673 family protein n=1 Tax=Nevskia sp. TaxID=1929292 RepID=UPI003F6F2C0F